MYRRDYIMALFMHSFSWSFMIMLPCIIYGLICGLEFNIWVVGVYLVNMATHAYIDDCKANKRTINLIQDQIFHLVQIMFTWFLLMT